MTCPLTSPLTSAPRFNSCSSQRCIDEMRKIIDLVPTDLIRNHLLLLSASTDAFLALRATFSRSLAVFSIASYILGANQGGLALNWAAVCPLFLHIPVFAQRFA